MYGEYQLWRIVLSPLLVTSFWFDLTIVMPTWLCFFCYVYESHRGTATQFVYFNLLSKCGSPPVTPSNTVFLFNRHRTLAREPGACIHLFTGIL